MKNVNPSKAVEIEDKIYWVGFNEKEAGFRCNPYIIDDIDEAILIEPGSVLHFEEVFEKVKQIIDLKKITKILVSHQDPDLCAAIPLFKEKIQNPNLQIITHSRASVLIEHYGARLPFYLIDSQGWELKLNNRYLQFLFTPYLHFPGSFVTYEKKSKILFSGDLFGAFSFDWNLFANENYMEAMKAFHENYMPSKDILNHSIKKIEHLDIKMIAPQHGSIIKEEMVNKAILTLMDLECGDYMYE